MCERSDSWSHLIEHCKRSSQRGSAVVVRWGRGSLCRIGLDHLLQLSGRSRRGHSASFKLHRRHLFPKKGRIHNEWRGCLACLWCGCVVCGARACVVGGRNTRGLTTTVSLGDVGIVPPQPPTCAPVTGETPSPAPSKLFLRQHEDSDKNFCVGGGGRLTVGSDEPG